MSLLFDRQRAEALIEGLRRTRDVAGFIPAEHLDHACAELHRSRATIWRWLREGIPAPRAVAMLTRAEKVALFDHHDVAGAAWEDLQRTGGTTKSRATFYRAAALVPEVERLYAAEGLPGARRAQLRLERREEYAGAVLISDHLLADVEVVLPGKGARIIRPWITAFQDPRSRAIAGVVVSVRPTRAEVLAAIGEAMRPTPDLSPVFGRPDMVRFDNGREFLTKALRSAAVELGFVLVPLRRRSPWLNGKIERWHQTVERELFSRMPYYTTGPRRENGELDIPADVGHLSLEEFVAHLRAWVAEYNFTRPHSSLDGQTPAAVWNANDLEVEELPEEALRRYLLEAPKGKRVVEPRGVFYNNGWYTDGALQDLVTRHVTLRVMPHNDLWVDVYDGGRLVCRAVRQREASPERRQKVLDSRAGAARRAAAVSRSMKQGARVRWAGMHGEQLKPQQVNTVSEDDPALQTGGQLQRARDLGYGDEVGRRRT